MGLYIIYREVTNKFVTEIIMPLSYGLIKATSGNGIDMSSVQRKSLQTTAHREQKKTLLTAWRNRKQDRGDTVSQLVAYRLKSCLFENLHISNCY